MSSILSGLEGVATRSAGEAFAFGLGFALGAALAPEATRIAQVAWGADPSKAVDAGTAAGIVAEDVERFEWGKGEAVQHGISESRFQAILGEVLNAPGFGELVRMLRRGTIGPDDFLHGLRKAKLEDRWDTPLEELRGERLDLAVIATAIQRGIIRDPGLLPVGPPTEAGRVPPMPVADIDALKEAAASGYNREQVAVVTRIVGLPPAPGELLQLLNRGVIGEVDYLRGIAEGNTRDEWGAFLLTLKRRLLTPHEYAEAHLRGLRTPAERNAGAALSGMEPADTQLLYDLLGRPLNVRAITTGLARGGTFGGVYHDVPEPYLDAIRRSAIRPEYGNLAYANRYSYPSAFVLRRLAESHELTEQETHSILLELGWRPDLADKVARAWAGGPGAKADTHVAKAETQLWATLHKSYVEDETDDTHAGTTLTAIGVPADAHPAVLALWGHERDIVRRTLTPSQIKKAFKETRVSRDEALARLERLGYNPTDAGTLLDE